MDAFTLVSVVATQAYKLPGATGSPQELHPAPEGPQLLAWIANTSDNESRFVETGIRPDPLQHHQIVLVSVLYSLIILLSVGGNVATIWVYTSGSRSSKADIRLWLINLAIADLLMSIFCIPFTSSMTLLDQWIFPKAFCPLAIFIQNLSVTASVYTNMALGIDRYIVIANPLRSRRWSARAVYSIPWIWVIGVAFSAVNIKVTKAYLRYKNFDTGEQYFECAEDWSTPQSRTAYTMTTLVLCYVIPLVLLAGFYLRIAQIMRRAPILKLAVRNTAPGYTRTKRKRIKMLAVVVLLFAFCWAPLHIFLLLYEFLSSFRLLPSETLLALYLCFHVLAMCSCFTNPLIYGFLNDTFRADLMELMVRRCLRRACCPVTKRKLLQKCLARRSSSFNMLKNTYSKSSSRATIDGRVNWQQTERDRFRQVVKRKTAYTGQSNGTSSLPEVLPRGSQQRTSTSLDVDDLHVLSTEPLLEGSSDTVEFEPCENDDLNDNGYSSVDVNGGIELNLLEN